MEIIPSYIFPKADLDSEFITVSPIVITRASYEFKGYGHKITKPSLKPLPHVRYLVPWEFTK